MSEYCKNCYELTEKLQAKEQEYEELRDILRKTKEYEEVCTTCKDEILTYPSISGRTDYTDEEVEVRTLKQIISTLQAKEQECEELKKQLDKYLNQEEEEIRQLNNDNKLDDILLAIEKANYKLVKEYAYKKSLDEIEKIINKQRYIISGVRAPLKPIIMRINRDFLSILEIINKTKEGK